jgi:tRNA pseudouridine38-40 synthase
MKRYFIEVAYKGTHYSGFQVQENANTIQAEVEKAFNTVVRQPVILTGSSRTDAGVHALQNFFHFDTILPLHMWRGIEGEAQFIYKINSLLPADIAVRNIYLMPSATHSRFNALSREYEYKIYTQKNPFLKETAFYYPYKLNLGLMKEAALLIKQETNFYSFSKTNTQVQNFNCIINISEWRQEDDLLIYHIKANRFLRGMVRLLTATQIKLGREKISMSQFTDLFRVPEVKCHFSVPPTGLFLKAVHYPQNFFP